MNTYGRTTILLVKDLARSSDFYANCLGYQVENQEPGLNVQFDLGDQSLRLVRMGKQEQVTSEGPQVLVSVGDIDRLSRALRLRGLSFQRLTYESGAEYLELRDPDGYKIVFREKI